MSVETTFRHYTNKMTPKGEAHTAILIRMSRMERLIESNQPICIMDFLEYGHKYFCLKHVVSAINNQENILRGYYDIY